MSRVNFTKRRALIVNLRPRVRRDFPPEVNFTFISWKPRDFSSKPLEVSLFNLIHFVLKKYVWRIRISPLLPLIMKFNKQQEPIQCLSNTRWPTATHWVTKSQLGGEGKFKRFHLIRKGIWSQFFCDFSKKIAISKRSRS